jgi:hypothetical protein
MPPIYNPPGIWPGPGYPAHPIAPGGPPPGIWPPPGGPPGIGGGPIIPPSPPLGTWGGDAPWPGYATPPIAGPPIFNPLPPDSGYQPPPFPPTGPPDLASPGFWCLIVIEGAYENGFIQTAINTGPDHEPKPPTQGLPGTYVGVWAGQLGPRTAWVPTESDHPEHPEHPDKPGKPEPKAVRR